MEPEVVDLSHFSSCVIVDVRETSHHDDTAVGPLYETERYSNFKLISSISLDLIDYVKICVDAGAEYTINGAEIRSKNPNKDGSIELDFPQLWDVSGYLEIGISRLTPYNKIFKWKSSYPNKFTAQSLGSAALITADVTSANAMIMIN